MPSGPLRRGLPMLLAVLCISLLATPLYASPVSMKVGSVRVSSNVKNIFELRWNKLTRQGWDISCGAAALSTLLTYYSDRPFSEMAITLSILKNSDPELVRQRGGFSLFDLKRFVNAVGLEGLGYGEMTIDDLEAFSLPAILPIKIKDFDHFVIFKKRVGNKILVGDPAFGNISIPADTFLEMWKNRIAFFVVTGEEKQQLARQEPLKARASLSLQSMEVAIPDPAYIRRLLGRIPTVPLTRK
jgi:predicted double-glycine peptidase